MKKSIKSLFILLSVSKTLLGQYDSEDELLKFPLKTIITYCQSNTDTAYSKVVLTYDKDNRLIEKSWYRNSVESNRTVYTYNAMGLLMRKEFYNNIKNSTTPHSLALFEYDSKNRLSNERNEGEVNIKNQYSYNQQGQLESTTSHCNYYNIVYSYKYDSNGRIIEKYKDGQIQVRYEYAENHLVKEIQYHRSGDIEIVYEYDANGLLITKTENGKVIEKNSYFNGQLIERWSYYFGIDPGYSPCYNNFIVKYEYY